MEELAAKAEEQQLDADVEVPHHKTWRAENVEGDVAESTPEQVNSFVQRQKFREDRRVIQTTLHCRLNNEEIMELCMFLNELCARPQQYSIRRRFASCATRSRLCARFAMHLTTARVNGTMWDRTLYLR